MHVYCMYFQLETLNAYVKTEKEKKKKNRALGGGGDRWVLKTLKLFETKILKYFISVLAFSDNWASPKANPNNGPWQFIFQDPES